MSSKKTQNISDTRSDTRSDTGLFIFHRDLRAVDNKGLLYAQSKCSRLYTCFIFTPEQVSSENKYRSVHSIAFMLECLDELGKTIHAQGGKLLFFYGDSVDVLQTLIREANIDCVFSNRDYTPYAVQRDKKIMELCQTENIGCEFSADYYLVEPNAERAYRKYTPFYEAMQQPEYAVVRPSKVRLTNLTQPSATKKTSSIAVTLSFIQSKMGIDEMEGRIVEGGRKSGVACLKKALREQVKYGEMRDELSYSTSHLSAHLKFGTVSIREAYWAFADVYGKKCRFIAELYWRDFFAHILYAYPETLKGKYGEKMVWTDSVGWLNRWKSGKTGFPVVDAGMRELNQTGYMHNRSRMVVASFLVKTLGIDWRLGERYFAEKLTDYDVASNNGNWQNISSTGMYNQPYFRDMNPWIQSAKFDKDCEYIKKWVPELKEVEPRVIHKWHVHCKDPKYKNTYVEPIVDYSLQKNIVLGRYKKAFTS